MLNRTRLEWMVAIGLCCAGLSACAANPPTSMPATTATSPAELRLADAVPIDRIESAEAQVDISDKLAPPASAEPLYFGAVNVYPDAEDEHPSATRAVIAQRDKAGRWTVLPVAGTGIRNNAWRFVGSGPRRGEVWAVIDTALDDVSGHVALLHSRDGGLTWTMRRIAKPTDQSVYFDFAMDRQGKGRLTFSLEADEARHQAGLYHLETSDWGETFSEPRFEADAILRADPATDADQPPLPQERGPTTRGA